MPNWEVMIIFFCFLFKNTQNDSEIISFRTFFKDLKNLSKLKSLSPVLSCCRGYCSAHPPSLPERAGEPACLERILSNVKMLKKLVILRKNKLKSAKSIAEMLRFQLESTCKGCWWMSVDKKNILVKTKKMKSDGLLFMWLISSRSASKAAASTASRLASNVLLNFWQLNSQAT